MAFLYTLIPVYFFNFFLILCDFYILRCFVSFLSLSIPTSYMFIATGSIHAKSYFNMKISSTNHQSINTKHEAESMKTNTSCMNLVLYYDVAAI